MSYNKTKCDPVLGAKIRKHLTEELKIETPLVDNGLSRTEKIDIIEKNFTEIMKTIGLDLSDDSLMDTPTRVAKMYVNEIFYGLDADAFPKCTAVDNKMSYDEMVIECGINVQSNCEHHFVVIDGLANVAYIPNKKVIGLSKLGRIVEYFSKRPQIQERLTAQIHGALTYILETEDVGVVIDAHHACVSSRGIEDTGARTITSKLGGRFREDPQARSEFMSLVNRNNCN